MKKHHSKNSEADSHNFVSNAAASQYFSNPASKRPVDGIDNSPRQSAQHTAVLSMQPATQRQLVQGKFPVQRQAPEEDDMLQGKFALQRQAPEEDDMLQGKFALQRQAPEEDDMLQGKMTATVQKKDESNNGIPHEVQAKMETAMNADFSNVQLHPNSSKAPEVGALAYTQGNDIHFAPGQFSPDTSSGRQLLGHELAHVVQQREGRVQPTTEVAGMPVNDNPALESEADKMGAKGV